MLKLTRKEEEEVRFINCVLFWESEYAKRYIRYYSSNSYVVNPHDADFSGHFSIPFGTGIDVSNVVPDKHMLLFKDFENDEAEISSDQLLSDAYQGNISSSLRLQLYPTSVFPLKDMSPKTIYESYSSLVKNADNISMQPYIIDFSKSIEAILCEIRLEYYYRNRDTAKKQNALRKVLLDSIKRKKGIRKMPKDPHIPRAVGIWLWDYLHEKEIDIKFKHKSFHAFHDRFHRSDSKLHIDRYKDDTQLGRLLRSTIKCIEQIKVLKVC